MPERQPLIRPMQPDEGWSMDFVFGDLANGRRSNEAVQIAVDTLMPALYVTRILDQVKAERGLPKVIRTDNGPEFAGRDHAELGGMQRCRVALHPTWQAGAERLHRKLQQPVPG